MSYIRYYIENGIGDVSDNTQTSADDSNNTNNQTTPSQSQQLQVLTSALNFFG